MTEKARFYFHIAATSGVTIYRQIIDQVKTLSASQRIIPGDFLPSVRQVAQELEINPMTVSKAYSWLEKEGVLEYVRGQGMRVKEGRISKKDMKEREEALVPILKQVIMQACQLSIDPETVTALLERLWKESAHE